MNEENFILANHEAMIRDYGRIAGEIKNQLLSDEEDKPDDDDVFEFEPENDGGDKV